MGGPHGTLLSNRKSRPPDENVEDAIYDSCAMLKFMSITFLEEDAPDATTFLKFWYLLEKNQLNEAFFDVINRRPKSLPHVSEWSID